MLCHGNKKRERPSASQVMEERKVKMEFLLFTCREEAGDINSLAMKTTIMGHGDDLQGSQDHIAADPFLWIFDWISAPTRLMTEFVGQGLVNRTYPTLPSPCPLIHPVSMTTRE